MIHVEAPSHAMQFAETLRETADENLVAPLETFVAAAHREPDLAEKIGLRVTSNLERFVSNLLCRRLKSNEQRVLSNSWKTKRRVRRVTLAGNPKRVFLTLSVFFLNPFFF